MKVLKTILGIALILLAMASVASMFAAVFFAYEWWTPVPKYDVVRPAGIFVFHLLALGFGGAGGIDLLRESQ